MLAELQTLSSSLRRCGLNPPGAHKWVKPLEKGDFVIANLDPKCEVREVEFRSSSEGAGIYKIQKDNHNGFPATKLDSPIFLLPADHPKRTELARTDVNGTARAAILESLLKDAPLSASAAEIKRLRIRLQEFARELRPLFSESPAEGPAVRLLLERLADCEIDPTEFLKQIVRCAIAAVARGEDPKLAEQLLIGTLKPKGGGIEERKITLVLDVARAPEDDFPRVAHGKMEALYHRVLLAQERGAPDGICSLTGAHQQIEHGTFPKAKLPEIDETILFAMNDQTPCHDRYRRKGADIFPTGKNTADDLYKSALWITAQERKRKTWAPVPRNDGPRNDLLIAYLDSQPESPAEIAGILTDAETEGLFESEAASVISALEGQRTIPKDDIFHTLVLRRISKGQVQVELNRQYRVERLRAAVVEWRDAAANVPEFGIYAPKGKGRPAALLTTRTPYPGEVVRASRSYWIRSGEERQWVIGCDLATVYDLFLGEGVVSDKAGRTLLGMVVARCSALLLRCGEQFHRHGPIVRDLAVSAREPAMAVITILGITLYKLKEYKEKYMSEPAFLVGRMLALADVLHAQYCTVVRGDDLPPQLLGNQHFAMASDHPKRALAVLGHRLVVYKAWAQTARVKPEAKEPVRIGIIRGKWALARLGEVTSQLEGKVPAGSFDDAGRAEMLLGYLSREPKEAAKGETEESNGRHTE